MRRVSQLTEAAAQLTHLFVSVICSVLFVRTATMDPGVVHPPENSKTASENVDPAARFCPACGQWQVSRNTTTCRLGTYQLFVLHGAR